MNILTLLLLLLRLRPMNTDLEKWTTIRIVRAFGKGGSPLKEVFHGKSQLKEKL